MSTRSKRGVALLTVLMLLMVTLAFTSAVVLMMRGGAMRGNFDERHRQASHLAQSALQMALKNIQDNHGALDQPFTGNLPGHPELAFEVKADKNTTASARPSTLSEVMIPPGHIDLKATAIIDGQRIEADFGSARELAAQAELKFDHAVFATESRLDFYSTTMRIDSYDSALGIAPFTAAMPLGGPPPPDNCNATVRAVVSLDLGDGLLCGNAMIGPGVGVTPASPGPTRITGAVQPSESYVVPIRFQRPEDYLGDPLATPPSQSTQFSISPGCYGNTTYLGSDKITLESGLYYFESLNISGGTRVVLNLTQRPDGSWEPVIIYAGTGVTFGGEINMEPVNPSHPPEAVDLQIYCLDKPSPGGEHGRCGMISNTRFRGVLVSGQAILDLNGPVELFGAVTMGSTWFDLTTMIHQDRALLNEVPSGETMWVLYHQLD